MIKFYKKYKEKFNEGILPLLCLSINLCCSRPSGILCTCMPFVCMVSLMIVVWCVFSHAAVRTRTECRTIAIYSGYTNYCCLIQNSIFSVVYIHTTYMILHILYNNTHTHTLTQTSISEIHRLIFFIKLANVISTAIMNSCTLYQCLILIIVVTAPLFIAISPTTSPTGSWVLDMNVIVKTVQSFTRLQISMAITAINPHYFTTFG